MKKIFLIILLVILSTVWNQTLQCQSLSVFDIDTSAFPKIKAKFFAFDITGNQITILKPSDFTIKENSELRNVTNISCPPPEPPQNVSIAMSIDVSGSMSHGRTGIAPVELGKLTAKELCNRVAMPPSEFALQTCDNIARILNDFTTDRNVILSKLAPVNAGGDNDFLEQLLNQRTGLLNIAKTGKYKRVAIIYTDVWWHALQPDELQRCKDTCSKYNIEFYAVIYSRPESEPNGIKKSLKELTEATGGYFYDGITEEQAAKDISLRIQSAVQGGNPCEIEWESGMTCFSGIINVEINLNTINATEKASYKAPNSSIAKLEFKPQSVKFLYAPPGIKKNSIITVTARNADFNVTNIASSNPAFEITPTNFSLKSGQSRNLTVSFVPADSGYTYSKFTFENDICQTKYYVSGGFPGKKPKIKTLKLIHPNGSEVFVVGKDTVITWEGVLPEEKVKLEYSKDNGVNWINISDKASDLSYKWRVPKTPSNQCLARVTAKSGNGNCDDVLICNQIWMGCNLDIDHYRNGDSIPEVKDSAEWYNLRTGAWCYYNNDTAMGVIYGKLYNWYAVNDPRGLAPDGWHIPSDSEWTVLANCLGGVVVAGGKLKSKGTIEAGDGLWYSPNTSATNESGFSAIPGGYRYLKFYSVGSDGFWWESKEHDFYSARGIRLSSDDTGIISGNIIKIFGLSVRCVRD